MPSTVLVVDDEPDIRELIQEYLEDNGFNVKTAADGEEMRRALAQETPDLLILDIMLPGEDGLSLTRYMRQHSDTPIILLTGKDDEVDRVVGLEMGADDYVAKPFSVRELLARVKSVLRRAEVDKAVEAPAKTKQITFAEFNFDHLARRLTKKNGEDVPLTTGEFNLLRAFTEHPNRVLDRDRLSDLANNRKWVPYDRSIDVLVGRLRNKIEDDPSNPTLIKTVRGSGYVLAAAVKA